VGKFSAPVGKRTQTAESCTQFSLHPSRGTVIALADVRMAFSSLKEEGGSKNEDND
jgi:hypothetical protein